MKVKVKDSAKCQKILEIEIPQKEVSEEFELFYEDARKTAQIPGFRKGKAPRHLIEQHYAPKAYDKVLTNLVNTNYYKAIEKEKIHPVTLPDISNVNFKTGENLTFSVKVDIRPEFKLKEYKNIELKKEKLFIKDEDVIKVIDYLRERYAQFMPVENRTTKIGDYLICDYGYSVDGKQIEKKEKSWLWIDKEMFLPGLSQELTGIGAGQTKEFKIVLPEKFKLAELAKKTAEFTIQVKEIKEKKLPELNDDFAKIIGKNTLTELQEQVKQDLIQEKEVQIKQDLRIQLINSLEKSMLIDVPPTMVAKREQLLKDTARERLKQQGLKDEQIEAELNKVTETFSKEALKQIRIFFILENIARTENISVDDKEIDKRIELISQSYHQPKEDVLKYLREKNLLENLHWEIWEEKIISFLIDQAKIEEVAEKKR
ncbi:MAG: trigger factor [Candidatus Omnitrophota bacterium]